jgi:pyrroloquinoline quinone (PQQ) biosynthesis protein C
MHIDVPVHDVCHTATARDWAEVVSLVSAHRPRIEALAKGAFAEGDRKAWEEVQRLLYHWNIDDLERRTSITDPTRVFHHILRNAILAEEEDMVAASVRLQCMDRFTPEVAVQELYDLAKAHPIATHPLLVEMSKNGLPKDAVRLFLENYYINNRVFHLHIAALSLSAPLELRGEMYRNLNDELGQAVFNSAHPVIFLRNFRSIGRPETITPLVESLHLLNQKVYAALLSGDYRYGVGGFGFLELTMPRQMQQIYHGLQRSGLPEEDLEFWPLHVSIDERHGEDWFNEMRQIIHTPEHALSALRGGKRVLDARAGFYDGVWNALSGTLHHEGPRSTSVPLALAEAS